MTLGSVNELCGGGVRISSESKTYPMCKKVCGLMKKKIQFFKGEISLFIKCVERNTKDGARAISCSKCV